jgi:hypothetical protein
MIEESEFDSRHGQEFFVYFTVDYSSAPGAHRAIYAIGRWVLLEE